MIISGPLVDAAVERFAAGYETASVRQIAMDAGLDPAVASGAFETKEALFVQVAAALIDPVKALATVTQGPLEQAAERLLRYFLALLNDGFIGLVRSAVVSEAAARPMREFLAEQVHGEIAARLPGDRPDLRTALAASQLVGIAITRHLIGLAPLRAAATDELTALVAPVLRHYLTGGGTEQTGAPGTWLERFHWQLAEVIEHGSPSLRAVARGLAVSPRTLQRQLAAHGTTWRAELESLRQRRASQARQRGAASMVSLARSLGYTDPRSVRRALRRWDIDKELSSRVGLIVRTHAAPPA